jgi:DNA-binding phage protein
MTTNNLTRSHEEATIERFQKDPELASEFLAAILIDGDKDELLYARTLVAKAFPEAEPLNKS